ncbi:Hypothetical protein FKW44_009292 [Caligus rogercresseyi]|uniref:Uncharacterized protein n=1 Tax=Caligus rogercresseyi TaxID=217165 RepID=A0A7T8K8S5_CALRO|nr:Hypothetical protein FKW44_009292 [Caligus rogercresseyi]
MSHEKKNRERIADLLKAKDDKKEIVEIVTALWLQFTIFPKALKDGKGTGRTPSSGQTNNKRTEDFQGKVKEAVKEDPTKSFGDRLGPWMWVLYYVKGFER